MTRTPIDRERLAAIGEAVVRYIAPPGAEQEALKFATRDEVMEWLRGAVEQPSGVTTGDEPPPLTDAVRERVPHFDRTDRDLLAWAIRRAGFDSTRAALRWAHVRDLFGVGSTVAVALCDAAGVAPNEEVPANYEEAEPCPECAGVLKMKSEADAVGQLTLLEAT